MRRVGLVLVLVAGLVSSLCSAAALAAVTPGWECVPTAAGQPVVSGGTGSAPSCGAGSTAVLAPTYVSSGVGGKPTVRFAAVNVQVVNGAGGTQSVNGTGNLVVGYDENPAALPQTGSHDLILGRNQSFTGYAALVAGLQNAASGNYSAVLGNLNSAAGPYTAVTGGQNNTANATASSVTGGAFNLADGTDSDVAGGCSNLAGALVSISTQPICFDTTGHQSAFSAVTGGVGNRATVTGSSVSGGRLNTAFGSFASVSGGENNIANGEDASILGGHDNEARSHGGSVSGGAHNFAGGRPDDGPPAGADNSVSGGEGNAASSLFASVLGGSFNTANNGNCQSIPATNTC